MYLQKDVYSNQTITYTITFKKKLYCFLSFLLHSKKLCIITQLSELNKLLKVRIKSTFKLTAPLIKVKRERVLFFYVKAKNSVQIFDKRFIFKISHMRKSVKNPFYKIWFLVPRSQK